MAEFVQLVIMRMFIPRKLHSELKLLTHKNEETSGALIYYDHDLSLENSDDIFVSAYYLMGEGNASHVSGDEIKVKTLMQFINQNPKFDYTMFHTHTRKTIQNHGSYYARNFSSGDWDTIRQNKSRIGEHYWEALFTPETVVFSETSVQLYVEDWFNDDGTSCEETNRNVMSKLEGLQPLQKRLQLPEVEFY